MRQLQREQKPCGLRLAGASHDDHRSGAGVEHVLAQDQDGPQPRLVSAGRIESRAISQCAQRGAIVQTSGDGDWHSNANVEARSREIARALRAFHCPAGCSNVPLNAKRSRAQCFPAAGHPAGW